MRRTGASKMTTTTKTIIGEITTIGVGTTTAEATTTAMTTTGAAKITIETRTIAETTTAEVGMSLILTIVTTTTMLQTPGVAKGSPSKMIAEPQDVRHRDERLDDRRGPRNSYRRDDHRRPHNTRADPP